MIDRVWYGLTHLGIVYSDFAVQTYLVGLALGIAIGLLIPPFIRFCRMAIAEVRCSSHAPQD